jgi:hypothetical protein
MPRPLNGYALTNHFRKLRLRHLFTPLEAYLFFELVALCNDEGWPTEFSATNNVLRAALNCSEPGLIKARKRLVETGLLLFTEGQNRRPTAYRFCSPKGLTDLSVAATEIASQPLTEDATEFSVSPPKSLTECSNQLRVQEGKHLTEYLTEGLTQFSPLYKEQTKIKRESSAALAAAPALTSEKKRESKSAKKPTATTAQIAALPLPHLGTEFAELWATFYSANTHQVGKPLTAFGLMLKKLGKYPEGFAVLMLERAIQGNWSGVENAGTTRAFTEWQAEQARQSPPPPTTTRPAGANPTAVALNHDFEAELLARERAEAEERIQKFRAAHATAV